MSRHRASFWSRLASRFDAPETTPLQQQRLDGWIRCLDDPELLETAQKVLRRPLAQLPAPPIALPAVVDADGRVLATALEAASPGAPLEAPPVVGLRGAYARRRAVSDPDATVTPVSKRSD